jgi:hypothetical protein
MAIDRYKYLRNENSISISPPVTIKNRTTDVFRIYNSDKTRLDRISAEIYEDPGYGWLILLANPEYTMEFDIPRQTVLRIPYPLRDVLSEYENKVIKNKNIG